LEKKTIISSLLYKAAETLGSKGIGLLISIVLARLLLPEEFGLVAIITVFINLSLVIIESGLNTALIQNKSVSEEDYSTVFYVSMVLATILVIILFFSAPWVAAYYNEESIILPLRIYSLSLFIAPFNSVQMAKLQREMRFKEIMQCKLTATVCAGILGIWLAWLNAGIWALIWYYFSHTSLSCISIGLVGGWRPQLQFSLTRAKILVGFGSKLLAAALINTLYNDIRALVVGKKFSVADLAYYNRGQQFPQIITSTLNSSVNSVMLPVLSTAQDKIERLRTMLQKAVGMCVLFVFPAMVGLAVVAEPVVRVFLTEKWLSCVLFMRIFCIAEIPSPIISAKLVAIQAMGRSGLYMKLEMVRRSMMLAILLISFFAFSSVDAIAYGYAIGTWVDMLIVMGVTKHLLNYPISNQVKDVSKSFFSAIIMGGTVFSLPILTGSIALQLVIQIVVGIAVYVGMCLLLKEETLIRAISAGWNLSRK